MPTLNEFLTAVERVTNYEPRQRRGSYMCRCPSHADGNPSLSVKEEGGKLLVHCFAGCDYTHIMAALGFGRNGTAVPPTPVPTNGQLTPRPKKKSQPLGDIVARYPYHDADGNLLYTKLRYTPKTFRVVGHNGRWGLNGAPPTLYNADLIAEADPETPIWIVEGEKDADNLGHFLGILATCNYDGAGKWSDDYTAALAGRHIVIVADNDDPGRKHAELVATAVTPTAETVRVLALEELPPHADITDYINLPDFNPAQLWERVEAIEPRPKEKPKDFETTGAKTEDYRKGMRWLGYEVKWNELSDVVEMNGRAIDDIAEAGMRSRMYDLGFKGITRMNDALLMEASDNRYHPIKAYLDGLKWDGKDYIGLLFKRYISEETGFGDTAWKRWMIGAVAKVMVKAQNAMMVWDGKQDVGKSTLARWLCPLPDYYIEAQLNPDDKDNLFRLATRWIWEVPEVDATTRKSDVAALKDFITREEVTVRRAYAKYDTVKAACASLIGTINSDGAGFLRDTTGNRRFLTIRLGEVDWAYRDELDVNNLWAQAVAMFRDGEPWRLTKDEREFRDHINRQYQTQSYLEVLFDKLFTVDPERTDDWLTAEEIMSMLEANGLKGSQNHNLKELRTYLTKLGSKPTRPRLANGSRPVAYTCIRHADTP